jgi:guanine deaminase
LLHIHSKNILTMGKEDFMREAIRLSVKNVYEGGGPFGAVIVKREAIIARGVNRVVPDIDPTAHAEINAIREACRKLGVFDLTGCEIYSSCEPCPMCLSAIYWAHLDRLYFANARLDAKLIGFDDSMIYEEVSRPIMERILPTETFLRDEALQAFRAWSAKPDKMHY